MNKKNSIKSHYLQKALITDILGDKLAIMKGGKVFNVSPKNAFSKYDLFNNSKISDVDKIEKLMNSKLESKFIILSRRIANDKGESKVSYRESMIIRLYLYMTLSRVRGRKINNIKTINAILNLEYDQRFKITNTDLDLFINKSFLYIIDNKEVNFMLNDAIFLSLPFDQKNHMSVLWKLDRQDPGYIFPISKNKSIIIINNNMINNLLTHNDSIHKMRFKLLDTSILINENSVMSPDGKKVNNMGMNETASNNEISKRNIDEWHYIYKHKKMIDFDYNITIIHTLFGIVSQRNFHKLSTNIFDNSKLLLDKSKINKLIKDINDLLKMEKLYTYKSKKVDVDYWTKNNLRRYINAVWTHLNEEVIQNLIYIKDKLESFQDTKTFKSY